MRMVFVTAMGFPLVFRERVSGTLESRCCFRMFLFLFPVPVRISPAPSGPDCLVNRVPKIEGPSGEKKAQKSRNSCKVNGRGCGCIGTVDSGPKCAQS